MDIKTIVENLIETFLSAGELSIDLREKGLKKEIKSDNTPVSNGDLEVNKFITKKIYEITGQYDICVIVQAPTISEINICIDNLRKISGVTDTNTVIILKTIS